MAVLHAHMEACAEISIVDRLHLQLGNNSRSSSSRRAGQATGIFRVTTILDFVHPQALLVLEFLGAALANDVGGFGMNVFDVHANPVLGVAD